jgi:hypothetical protein
MSRRPVISAVLLAAALTASNRGALAQSRNTASPAPRAEPSTWVILPQAGGDLGMTFSLGWTLGTHQGRARQVSGSLRAELDPLRIVEGEFRVPVAAMSTGSATRDCHMREATGIDYSRSRFPRQHVCVNDQVPTSGPDSVVFPEIGITIREVRSASPGTPAAPVRLVPNQPVDAQVLLGFSMHGMTQDLLTPIRLQMDNAQRVRATAEFEVRLAAFRIVVIMPTPMSIADQVKVKLNLLLARQE